MLEDDRRDGQVDERGGPEMQGRRAHAKIGSRAEELDLGGTGRNVAKLRETARSAGGSYLRDAHGQAHILVLAALPRPLAHSVIGVVSVMRPRPDPCHPRYMTIILHLLQNRKRGGRPQDGCCRSATMLD